MQASSSIESPPDSNLDFDFSGDTKDTVTFIHPETGARFHFKRSMFEKIREERASTRGEKEVPTHANPAIARFLDQIYNYTEPKKVIPIPKRAPIILAERIQGVGVGKSWNCARELISAFADAMEGHQALFDHAKILHGYINRQTIGIFEESRKGVLVDWDGYGLPWSGGRIAPKLS